MFFHSTLRIHIQMDNVVTSGKKIWRRRKGKFVSLESTEGLKETILMTSARTDSMEDVTRRHWISSWDEQSSAKILKMSRADTRLQRRGMIKYNKPKAVTWRHRTPVNDMIERSSLAIRFWDCCDGVSADSDGTTWSGCEGCIHICSIRSDERRKGN